jgi:hypothetical protein
MSDVAEVETDEIEDPLASLPSAAPMAPKARSLKMTAQIALDSLEAITPRLALGRQNGIPGAAIELRDHLKKLEAARAEFELAAIAHDEAIVQDATAARSRINAIRALAPEDAIFGVTAHKCCDGCGLTECMIAGGLNRCMHPGKGGVPPAHMNDAVIRSFAQAARDEISAQRYGYASDDGETDEDED